MALLHAPASLFHEQAQRALSTAATRALATGHAQVLLFDSSPWLGFHDQAWPLLTSDERDRALRFRLLQQRNTYVLAHALWRSALAWVLDCDASEVPLCVAPGGQPQLPGTPYATSLSHSGNQVAIAIGRTRIVGVDIEQSPPRAALRELAGVICTPDEAAAIRVLPQEQQELALLALWTRKEALLKAFGTGLREAPDSIAAPAGLLIAPPASVAMLPACHIHPLELGAGLLGAVAVPGDITRLSQHVLPPPLQAHEQ